MAQGTQAGMPGKNKSKGGISSQTMISAGLGGVVLIEGAALALLWKKVNDIAARSDPNINDNKHIAAYIALRDKEHDTIVKDLTERLKVIETEAKKPNNNNNTAPSNNEVALQKRINQLSTEHNALLKHVNELTEAYNVMEADIAKLQKLNKPSQVVATTARGRQETVRRRQEQSEDEQSVSSRSPSPVTPPPRRSTNMAQSTKKPTTSNTVAQQQRKPVQKVATATTGKKKTTSLPSSKLGLGKPSDEMPSDLSDS